MSTSDKAQELFDKGLSSLEEGNFNEALHYFNESIKLQPSNEVEDKIKECKEKIKEKKEKETPASEAPGEADAPAKSEDEIECEKIIDEKDYYKLLNVSKETIDQDELKKAYKKLAIKFHPDKNKSSRAEEAFKKISTAYQTLNDSEKRKLYDKYGTEEEFREKYYQANQQRYQEEDEYDIFDILFEGRGRRPARRRHFQQTTPEQQQKMKYLSYAQLVFFALFFLYTYLPILLEKKPLYVFERTEQYTIMKKTIRNKVPYYANEEFGKQFPNATVLKEEEKNIEKAYVEFTIQKCNERKDQKSQIEYRLWYVAKGSSQYYYYLEKLKELDFSICDIHSKLKNKLERGIGNDVLNKEEDEETKDDYKKGEDKGDEDDEEDDDDDKEENDYKDKTVKLTEKTEEYNEDDD